MTNSNNTVQTQDTPLSATIITKQTIANYKLVELKGSGGMANVYKAIQLSLDRAVALKLMHAHLNSSETFIGRFEKEAKRAAMLQHENIVSIIDYGNDNGEYYIAMEYIDGTSLAEMIKRQKRMPLEICLHICHQVAEGLKYAHSSGLVHRDIKPANIMISFDGRVMITDFGIAKSREDHSITATGQIMGSPSYMSPEQAAGKAIDPRSDIFSLGIILYEILSGEKPFRGDTYQALVTSIMSEKPQSLVQTRIDITPELDDVVQKALIKDLESRYQSAEELADDLFAQLSKFKIASFRKMMSDYLKSPIRTTEKLRVDKITDHMESALYFLAVGEGKLAEAKKEFQEVLRFDKNNISAKKNLARLEAQLLLRTETANRSHKGFFRYALYTLAALGTIVIMAYVFGVQPAKNESRRTTETAGISTGTQTQPASQIDNSSKPQVLPTPISGTKDGVAQNPGTADSQKTAVSQTGQKAGPLMAVTKSASNVKPSSVPSVSYNYPDQKLSRFGTLKVSSNIVARLNIDRVNYSWTNGPLIKVSPGRHLIEASAAGYKSYSGYITINRDQIDTLKIDLAPKR